MPNKIDNFVESLAHLSATPNAYNQYSTGNDFNAIRRRNLTLYLNQLVEFSPAVLLLGEAPGHQGCRLTGIPFMSEDIVLRGIPELEMFGQERGYQKTAEFERVHKEPSATIVWSTLVKFRFVPLLWASFPFHPYKAGDERTNRAPTKQEVELGKDVFQELMNIFQIKKVVAVGNVAHQSLADVGIRTEKIRHPSHGGKNEFVKGVQRLVKEKNR